MGHPPPIVFACLAAMACRASRTTGPRGAGDPGVSQSSGAAERSIGALPRGARVHRMKDTEQLGGPNAIGRPGDLLLENDQVAFVIDQLGSSSGFAETGGNLVDAADARSRQDEFGQLFTYFGKFPRQGLYDSLSSGEMADGTAWIEASGHELYEPMLAVSTRYSLGPSDRDLRVETAIENRGDHPLEIESLGDAVQWGGTEKVAPGKPVGFKGPSSGPYVGGVGRFASYAIAPDGDGSLEAASGGGWTDTSQRKNVRLAPRQSTRYSRVVIVGERPDTSSLVGALAAWQGRPVGKLQVRLPQGAQLPTGALVSLRMEGSAEAWTLASPYLGLLPVGQYQILSMPGRSPERSIGPIEVGPTAASVDVPIDLPAAIDVRCVGADAAPIPCKVTVEGIGGTRTPNFGSAFAAGPARNQMTTADGQSHVALAAGRYRLTGSRGPEYRLASVEIDLAPGDHRAETMSLARVVDTRGYVACDFHQHTMLSADAPVSARGRVIANAAEAVEVAVASEHNVIADLEPIVEDLHLDHHLVEMSGDELTSDASRRPWGHANAFPLGFDATRVAGGALPIRDRTPHDLFATLRAQGDVVVQVNHPRSGKNGYFDLLGFDRGLGASTDSAYDDRFDAVEVWNGRHVDARAAVIDDYCALLRTGHVVTPTADTDTHGIVGEEAGYPRTYVRVADDEHFESWDAGRTADLVRGIKVMRDVVLTNGPMLRILANGAPIGGIAKGRAVTARVHVECAPWVDVDTVMVRRASGTGAEREDEKRVTLAALPNGARGADVTFALRFDADDAFFILAMGHRPLTPVLGGDEREILPWAMTGAVWVDADGDGRALGR